MPNAVIQNLSPPEPLSFDGNVSENWKKWKKKFNIYLEATESTTKADAVKTAILLHTIGEEAYEKYETFELTEEQRKQYSTVVEAFEKYCVPKKNESVNRHLLFQRRQKDGQTFDQFLTEVKRLSLNCDLGALKDSLIKDLIISGVQNTSLKNRLLREDDLSLEKAERLCKASELADQQLKTLRGDQGKVDYVKKTGYKAKPWPIKKGSMGSNNGYRSNSREKGQSDQR